ncbi:hypothetical protein TRV_02368 [Trichophyton verrucosum HKI 0517]|uniref:Uncharacterized protein n=1 Tax=Trichophyton verrucosum (strain HKI 0517) TaxID=663202 RepID=D4D5J6_TRIVH|nr:uncharacterized protein TRV_02368 [Trichophyton verrucosum HKI 0517]EFE42856.1 hypothetical protein TRV_02368 [Trichophyton verrucosum HKI 0517]
MQTSTSSDSLWISSGRNRDSCSSSLLTGACEKDLCCWPENLANPVFCPAMHLCTALLLTGALVEYCESPLTAAAALLGVALLHAGAAQQASLRAKANGSTADREAIAELARQRVSFVLILYLFKHTHTPKKKKLSQAGVVSSNCVAQNSGRRHDAPSLKAEEEKKLLGGTFGREVKPRQAEAATLHPSAQVSLLPYVSSPPFPFKTSFFPFFFFASNFHVIIIFGFGEKKAKSTTVDSYSSLASQLTHPLLRALSLRSAAAYHSATATAAAPATTTRGLRQAQQPLAVTASFSSSASSCLAVLFFVTLVV